MNLEKFNDGWKIVASHQHRRCNFARPSFLKSYLRQTEEASTIFRSLHQMQDVVGFGGTAGSIEALETFFSLCQRPVDWLL
jgi:hypothetical protein